MDENQSGNNLLPGLIKSKLALDLTKSHGNYLQLVKTVLETDVTEENFQQCQTIMKNVTSILSYIEDHRKKEKNPFLEKGKMVDATHKEFCGPIEAAKDELQAKLNVVGRKIKEEEDRIAQEQQRVAGINATINHFILDSSITIASADNNEQLLQIERLVNLEKANKSKYQEFLPSLIERCNGLTTKIKEQKDLIKQKDTLAKQQKQALESGDDEKVQEIINKSELVGSKIEENTLLVQETASKSVLIAEIVFPESSGIKTRSSRWKIELVDQKEAMKKAPELLKVELDYIKANDVLRTLKDTGVLTGKDSYTLNGIRYYQSSNW